MPDAVLLAAHLGEDAAELAPAQEDSFGHLTRNSTRSGAALRERLRRCGDGQLRGFLGRQVGRRSTENQRPTPSGDTIFAQTATTTGLGFGEHDGPFRDAIPRQFLDHIARRGRLAKDLDIPSDDPVGPSRERRSSACN